MPLAESARRFWAEPTLAHFTDLRQEILASANYSPDTSAPEIALPYLESGAYEDVVRRLRPLLPGAFLSPSLHGTLAVAYGELGDEQSAKREAEFSKMALTGILLTGDGSQEHPYQVLRIQDEYDTLAYLGKQSVEQRLVREAMRTLDQHICQDGSHLWFDVSAFLPPVRTSAAGANGESLT
jgi:hypothetical protein